MTTTPNPREVVRVRHTDGSHYTTTRIRAEKAGHTVIEGHPAVDQHGRWLPPKPYTTMTAQEPATAAVVDIEEGE